MIGPMRTQFLTGLETWFTLPGRPATPPLPPYKMALITWLSGEAEKADTSGVNHAPAVPSVSAEVSPTRNNCALRCASRRRSLARASFSFLPALSFASMASSAAWCAASRSASVGGSGFRSPITIGPDGPVANG